MDPRVKTPTEGIKQQHAIAMQCYEGGAKVQDVVQQINRVRQQVTEVLEKAPEGPASKALNEFDTKLRALQGGGGGPGGRTRGAAVTAGGGLQSLGGQLSALMRLVEGADATPTSQAVPASESLGKALQDSLERWKQLRDDELPKLNEQLRQANLSTIQAPSK